MSPSDSQAAFLARVRAALGRAHKWTPRAPITLRVPPIPNEARVDQFERALSAVGGKVHRPADDASACDEIVSLAREHKVGRVAWIAFPALDGWGLREALTGSGVEVRSVDFAEWVRQEGEEGRARGALRQFLASADMTVGGADYAIAETGTVVLIAGVGNPRSATNLPPLHLAIIRPGQIVSTLFDLTPRLSEDAARASCITFITGPSRTSDIEQISTIGVHGPIELHVLIRP